MWLVKTEPDAYSFSDLVRDGRTVWDGVKNPTALRNLKAMKPGETVLIYHTGDERRVMGEAQVVREAYPDPKRADPRLVVVDLKAGKALPTPVELPTLKASALFKDSPLVRQGRLSVVPLSKEQLAFILKAGA
jgi:predicted RNA-binding protein with PUA-like domain